MFINRHTFIDINSLVRWDVGGETAWGEDQDMWPVHAFAAERAAHRRFAGPPPEGGPEHDGGDGLLPPFDELPGIPGLHLRHADRAPPNPDRWSRRLSNNAAPSVE